ncbi:hypothetical protein EMCRGX_G010609 [Ephydatia muelleri]
MTDPQVDPPLSVKKKKKAKKKKVFMVEPGAIHNGEIEKTPKQTSAADDEVITTSKCQRCKGLFKLMVSRSEAAPVSQSSWVCHNCLQIIRAEEKVAPPPPIAVKTSKEATGCNCSACIAKRENVCTPDSEREAQMTQTYWMDVRHVVRRIYRDNISLANKESRSIIGSDKMVAIVKMLCTKDPHQFFQRLETLAREYLLEVKVRLLEQLSCGFNSPQLAIEFVQMLLDEYSTLCASLPSLLYLLEPLEDDFMPKLGMTIELMNKNIFRELIFAESFMSLNLPLIVAQLRLACLSSDPYHRSTADALSHRYLSLDKEMEEVNQIWRSAKDRLNGHEPREHHMMPGEEDKRSHLEKVRTEAEAFKLMKQTSEKMMESSIHQDVDTAKTRPHLPHSGRSLKQQDKGSSEAPPTSSSSSKPPSSQLTEWSKLLFKCIKPVGDPDFRLNGDIATHTITLKLDMTELDLGTPPSSSRQLCTKDDLRRYRKLGLTSEEVVEVAMKLNALKALGINLRIEDLFDEEGLLLAENQDLLRGGGGEEAVGDDVYFLDDKGTGRSCDHGEGDHFSEQELAELQRAKELILKRQEAENGRSRQNDFLQSMTMKIRFMKRLTPEDLERNEGGRIIFNSCDQVQMKLTQLELNSIRLLTTPDAASSGVSDTIHIPANFSDAIVQEEYALIHPEGHKEFMDLLFEKRRLLDTMSAKPKDKHRAVDHYGNHCDQHCNHTHSERCHNGQKSHAHSEMMKADPTRGSKPLGGGFKPVYLNGSTQPCFCSACIGAMATAYSSDSLHRPLNPTDPTFGLATIEGSLSAQLNGDGEEEDRPPDVVSRSGEEGRAKVIAGALTKEGLWHNWVTTTSGSSAEGGTHQEPPSSSSSSSSPTPHCSHLPSNHSIDAVDLVCSESTRSSLSAGSCEHEFHTVHTTATQTGSTNAMSTTTAATDPPKRYCPCCYCELFGHNGPPTAPVSHNFTKQRDKMRLKLEKKKKESECNHGHHCHIHQDHLNLADGCISCETAADRSLDELLAFIEGMDGNTSGHSSPRPSKKNKKKQKKDSQGPGESLSLKPADKLHDTTQLAQDISTCQSLMETLSGDEVGQGEEPAGEKGDVAKSKQYKKTLKSDKPGQKTLHPDPPLPSVPTIPLRAQLSEDMDGATTGIGAGDEVDEELEAFKKFCFSTTPANNRKKLAVNMQEVMAKLK